MTYTTTREFAFRALRRQRPCRVRVELAHTDLTEQGYVRDPADLDWFEDWVATHLHARDLAAVCVDQRSGEPFSPTPENLAAFLFDVVRSRMPLETSAVGVSTSLSTWAWYRPERIEVTAMGDRARRFITRERGAEHERTTPEVE